MEYSWRTDYGTISISAPKRSGSFDIYHFVAEVVASFEWVEAEAGRFFVTASLKLNDIFKSSGDGPKFYFVPFLRFQFRIVLGFVILQTMLQDMQVHVAEAESRSHQEQEQLQFPNLRKFDKLLNAMGGVKNSESTTHFILNSTAQELKMDIDTVGPWNYPAAIALMANGQRRWRRCGKWQLWVVRFSCFSDESVFWDEQQTIFGTGTFWQWFAAFAFGEHG